LSCNIRVAGSDRAGTAVLYRRLGDHYRAPGDRDRGTAGAVALVWLIGVYAIVFGIIMLALSWRLREFQMK
jgi:hypothetical protein